MPFILSAFEPFPRISWWSKALAAGTVRFDASEPFRKMTSRNRYYISGAQGLVRLSIPLVHGRDQRLPMGEVRICNRDRWQIQHWRTLTASYRRAPFFESYEPGLQQLYHTKYELLADFNLASCAWLRDQLRLDIRFAADGADADPTAAGADLRFARKSGETETIGFPPYQQVFSDRTGMIPDLSLLDLAFSEGPYTGTWIRDNFG